MIFAVRQLQEKCIEQNKPLYLVFIDLTKAFDTVNREALWTVLERIWCPPKLVSMIRLFHDGMTGQVLFNGNVTDAFVISNEAGLHTSPGPLQHLFHLYAVPCSPRSGEVVYIRYR